MENKMETKRNYPTRMHEVLGVEAFEQFQIKGVSGHFFLTAAGQICSNEAGMDNNYLLDAINHGITRRPRLDGCQKHLLKLLAKLDLKWLTIDSQNLIIAWEDKPKRITTAWFGKEGDYDAVNRYAISASKCPTLAALVSWSDPEPLDIVQTLRDAGGEVEG